MEQHEDTVPNQQKIMNGPSEIVSPDGMVKGSGQATNPNYPPQFRPLPPHQVGGGPRPPNGVGIGPKAPQLQRTDSRSYLPPRLPLNGQQGPQLRGPLPPNYLPRPPLPGQRPIPPNTLLTRPPGPLPNQVGGPRPTGNVPLRPQQSIPGNTFRSVVNAIRAGNLPTPPEGTQIRPLLRPQQPAIRQPYPPQRQLSSNQIIPPQFMTEGSKNSNLDTTGGHKSTLEESMSSGVDDDDVRMPVAKNRSYSMAAPQTDTTKVLSEEERRRSVAAFGSENTKVGSIVTSSLDAVKEKMASLEEKTYSPTNMYQNGKNTPERPESRASRESPVDSRPQSVLRNFSHENKIDEDDDDVVIGVDNKSLSGDSTKSGPTPPKSTDGSIPPSPIFSKIKTDSSKTTPTKLSTEDIPSGIYKTSSKTDLSKTTPTRVSTEDILSGIRKASSKTDLSKTTPPAGASTEDIPSGIKKASSKTDLSRTTPKRQSVEDLTKNYQQPPNSGNVSMSPGGNKSLNSDEINRTPSPRPTSRTSMQKEPDINIKPSSFSSPKISNTPERSSSNVGRKFDILEINGSKEIISSPSPDTPRDKVKTPVSDSGRKSSASVKSQDSGKRPLSRGRKEGDNDSGVDESTQGNECTNGDLSSPKKTTSKIPGLRQSAASPTKTSASKPKPPKTPKTPDGTSSTQLDKKKLPMNKVQVGAAPSPNLKTIRSKIGSLDNTSYKPGGGKVKIENRKLDFSKVQPKTAAKNDAYTPKGGDKKIPVVKLKWEAKPKVGSLEKVTHKPGGGDKKIETVKLDFKDKAKPKVASKDNIKHVPGGGDIKSPMEGRSKQIEQKKIEFKVSSKIGSLDNVKHKPGGGDIKIFDDKDYLKQMSTHDHSPAASGTQSPVPSEGHTTSTQGTSSTHLVSDENLNRS